LCLRQRWRFQYATFSLRAPRINSRSFDVAWTRGARTAGMVGMAGNGSMAGVVRDARAL
jgi:hypothetical protein